MVLATETIAPTAIPWVRLQPINRPTPTPIPIESSDPQRPAEDCHPFHLQKLAEGKFQANRVHQQDDANFSQHFELVDLREGRDRE